MHSSPHGTSTAVTHLNIDEKVADILQSGPLIETKVANYKSNKTDENWTLLITRVRSSLVGHGLYVNTPTAKKLIESALQKALNELP